MAAESVGGESFAIAPALSQGYRQASSQEGVVPRATGVVTGMRGRFWLTGMLIGTTAEWIMQDSLCSVVAAGREGWRHDVS